MRAPALLALTLMLPVPLVAQEATEVLEGIRNGGGWVTVPIEAGQGHVSTMRLPTVGMTLTGCLNVWFGHSGTFAVKATDNITGETLAVDASPGEGVPFRHTFGMTAQVDFDFTWSEPRDTTLIMWVGLVVTGTQEESCNPIYPGRSRR